MPMEVSWRWDERLAALHYSYCLSCNLTDVLLPAKPNSTKEDQTHPLAGVERVLLSERDRVWELLFQLSPDCVSNRELAERICVRLLSPEMRSESMTAKLASQIREAEVHFAQAYPRFADEMKLRAGPMQQQWEAYGPGLLKQMDRVLGQSLLVKSAEVYLVPPVSGGMGWAHLHTNRCHIEALLTNVTPELPEVLRLAWLLGQLDFERPEYSDWINAFRLRKVAGLAMLPPTLMAAEQLGISTYDSQMLYRAVELWRLESPGPKAQALAEVLAVWWQTVLSGQTRWSVALTGLDRMISDPSAA